jgi:ketosteroid isomerase-like protein
MDLGKLRVNQLSDAGWTWYQDYLDALDAYDLDRYAAFLADDVSIQFNNDAPLQGKDVATQGLAQFWGAISGMGFALLHEPLNIYGTDTTYVLEALNHYDRPGQERITVRAAAFTDRGEDGKVTSVRLYQDVSPLFAPQAAAAG